MLLKKYKLKIKIIVVSKIEKQKGIELLVNSLSKIKKFLTLNVISMVKALLKIKEKIKKNKMSNSICMKRTRDLTNISKNMIYIYCLHTEGYPNSLVEAMMCGFLLFHHPAIMVQKYINILMVFYLKLAQN